MDDLGNLMLGFQAALTWWNVLFMIVGVLLGIVVGVLPGLGGPNGVAILLPLTFGMDPLSAVILLSSIYWGALFGGAITSILFNIPGEAWSVATTFDGYPMAQRGQAAEALTAAFTSSFIGAFVAIVLITFIAPAIAGFALRFGPPEFFAVMFLSFASFVGLSRGSPLKTLSAMMLGFLLAAACAGELAERGWDRGVGRIAAVLCLGHVLLFAPGVAWLAVLFGGSEAVAVGLTPFLAGSAVKAALGTALVAAAGPLLRRESRARS